MSYERARQLRRRQTDVERKLWYGLRNRSFGRYKFRRQQPIGPYFADFVCFEAMLIIELDGGHHMLPEHARHDRVRTAYMQSRGFRVKRYWNCELEDDLGAVLHDIGAALGILYEPMPDDSSKGDRLVRIGARARWLN